MKSVGNVINSLYKRVSFGTQICDKCNTEYEVYDFYVRDKKITIDFCQRCYKEQQDQKIAQEAQRQHKLAVLKEYDRISVIPCGLENASFENYTPQTKSQKDALELSIAYSEGKTNRTTLFFHGDTGLGKSHLSYSIYKKFVEREKPSVFIDLPSLLTMIRNTYNKSESGLNQERIMNAIQTCELLVLDDIGAEYVKPDANGFESWAADILFQIVNARQGKKTVYTTNFNSVQLSQKYGMMSKRIISRMMNNAQIIKLDGQDYRLRGLS